MRRKNLAAFPEILPPTYDFDPSNREHSTIDKSVRVINIPDSKIIEYLDAGVDIERMGEAWDNSAFEKSVALATGDEWAKDNPPDPIDGRVIALARSEIMERHIGHCPEHWIHGSDDAGHSFAKEIYCGREWCPVCRENDSVAHLRRFARWLPKVQTANSIGYFVIEMPYHGRERWHSKAELESAGMLTTSVLKGDYAIKKIRASGKRLSKSAVDKIHAHYFDKGLRRWHYFGDAPAQIGAAVESEQGIKQLPLSDDFTVEYNPHLNVLTDTGRISKIRLARIKRELREAFNEPELIVHYEFRTEPGRLVHLVKYVTRATFLDISWDKFLAGSLYGFRNMRSWGKWEIESPVWSLADLENSTAAAEVAGLNIAAINSLGRSFCYIDGLPISWTKPQPISLLHFIQEKQASKIQTLGAGYFRLPDIPMMRSLSLETDEMKTRAKANKVRAERRAADRCKVLVEPDLSLVKGHPESNGGLDGAYSESISAGMPKTNSSTALQGMLDIGIEVHAGASKRPRTGYRRKNSPGGGR
jgi:hypothetical protein